MATSVSTAISGLASGFDWSTFISEMIAAERSSETTLTVQQAKITNKKTVFDQIKTYLSTLQTDAESLAKSSLYDSRTASSSDTSVATATASTGATNGNYTFKITQLATATQVAGTANAGAALSTSSDVSKVTLATANVATAFTAGTFTVNGNQVTIATSDTLKSVFDKIASATNNAVTASYDSSTDKISLSSSGTITLGTSTDTSNFLSVAKLTNNNSVSVTSTSSLGGVNTSGLLSAAGFSTAVTGDSSGAGSFKINGVSISYNINNDSVQNLLDRINNSSANVTASYDSINDRFLLTSTATGNTGISMSDVSGNFLAASGLSSGTTTLGNNLAYTVNGGGTLTSQSNTISSSSSGITGLSITALTTGSTTISVATNASAIKSEIATFVEDYNTVQAFIASETSIDTSSSGSVTAGILATDSEADDITSTLRAHLIAAMNGLTGSINSLSQLGYDTNGYDDTISLTDSTTLDSVLSQKLSSVKAFFSDTSNGWAAQMETAITGMIGDNGTLIIHENTLTDQSNAITTQISTMEKKILADKTRMTTEFVAMETAQAKINSELSYLSKNFG